MEEEDLGDKKFQTIVSTCLETIKNAVSTKKNKELSADLQEALSKNTKSLWQNF